MSEEFFWGIVILLCILGVGFIVSVLPPNLTSP